MEKSRDAFRTISEVAELLDTPAHVLRFWKAAFRRYRPVKRAGGRRYYRPTDVALLSGIKRLLHSDGLTIRGVQKVLREHGIRHVMAMADPAVAALSIAPAVEPQPEPEAPPPPPPRKADVLVLGVAAAAPAVPPTGPRPRPRRRRPTCRSGRRSQPNPAGGRGRGGGVGGRGDLAAHPVAEPEPRAGRPAPRNLAGSGAAARGASGARRTGFGHVGTLTGRMCFPACPGPEYRYVSASSGRSAAWLARPSGGRKVASSNLAGPTNRKPPVPRTGAGGSVSKEGVAA